MLWLLRASLQKHRETQSLYRELLFVLTHRPAAKGEQCRNQGQTIMRDDTRPRLAFIPPALVKGVRRGGQSRPFRDVSLRDLTRAGTLSVEQSDRHRLSGSDKSPGRGGVGTVWTNQIQWIYISTVRL